MASAEPGTAESGWTKENLQKLFAAMKACLPTRERTSSYRTGLRAIDWSKVMFPPFSPEECQHKWMEIMEKIRKIRSLTELIVEAEGVILSLEKNEPKKPPPPNATYFKENAATFRKQHPEMSVQQLLKFSIKKFNDLPVKEKDRYKKKFNLTTEEYKDQKRKTCEQNPRQKKRRKVSADKKGTNEEEGFPPKPPNNGYLLFCKEQSSSISGGTVVQKHQHIKEWARLWRDLSLKRKATYIRRSNELKKEYITKLNLYVNRFDEETRQQILRKKGIDLDKMPKFKQVKCVTRLPNEPKMPSKSGNSIFCQHQMELMKDKIPNAKERFAKVNQMWSTLSAIKKEQYKKEVNDRMRKYTVELWNWFKTLTPQQQREYRESNPSKAQYLKAERGKMKVQELHLNLPSDSEDELIEISSSEEEEDFFTIENNMDDDDDDDDANEFMFEM